MKRRSLLTLSSLAACLGGLSFSTIAQGSELLVQGQVLVAGSGNALPGASVHLVRVLTPYEAARRELAGSSPEEEAGQGVSRADGTFSLVVPEPGLWQVVVRAQGFVPRVLGPLPVVQTVSLPPLPMDPAIVARIAVTTRTPADETRIAIPDRRGPSGSPWDDYGLHRILVGTGTIEVPVRQGAKIEALAFDVSGGEVRRLPLERSTRIASGKGCADELTVAIVDSHGAAAGGVVAFDETYHLALGLSGDKGQIRLCRSSGTVALLDQRWQSASVDLGPLGVAANQQGIPVMLSPPVRVASSAVDADTKFPVFAGIAWTKGSPGSWARLTQRGLFELALPRAGGSIEVVAPDYLPAEATKFSTSRGSLVELRLVQAGSIEGLVRGEGSAPLIGARLEARASSFVGVSDPSARVQFGYVDGRGSFVLANLAQGRPYKITATALGWPAATVSRRTALRGERDELLEIVLRRPRTLVGRVISASGVPLKDVLVEVIRAPDQSVLLELVARGQEARDLVAAGSSNAAGEFRLSGPTPGQVGVAFRAQGFVTQVTSDVGIDDGAETNLGDVTLQEAMSLRGIVVDSDEHPMAGALVRARSSFRSGKTSHTLARADSEDIRTDADGRFSVGGFAAEDRADIFVSKTGYLSAALRGVAVTARDPLRIRLAGAATLSGFVRDATGRGIDGAAVAALPERARAPSSMRDLEDVVETRSERSGAFRVDGVPAGRVHLRATAPGFLKSNMGPLELEAGDVRDNLVIRLRGGGSLAGSVTADDGAAAPGVRVSIGDRSAETADDGSYRLEDIVPGHYLASANDGNSDVTREVDIADAEEVIVDFVVRSRKAVSGRVVTPAGMAVEGAMVVLRWVGGVPGPARVAWTDSGGGFLLRAVAPGMYQLDVLREGYRQTDPARKVVVDGNSIEGLEIAMKKDEG
ncbi:MAG TPA: carboxypeptidase-like regulatory domain-containing protein [Thermoanaerobaculia bacterium]|nr:carboxypeptidase-like regulatory domain-containing protein [Thermoanaerobaculia bacterium]